MESLVFLKIAKSCKGIKNKSGTHVNTKCLLENFMEEDKHTNLHTNTNIILKLILGIYVVGMCSG
jgi:hypothetical protein